MDEGRHLPLPYLPRRKAHGSNAVQTPHCFQKTLLHVRHRTAPALARTLEHCLATPSARNSKSRQEPLYLLAPRNPLRLTWQGLGPPPRLVHLLGMIAAAPQTCTVRGSRVRTTPNRDTQKKHLFPGVPGHILNPKTRQDNQQQSEDIPARGHVCLACHPAVTSLCGLMAVVRPSHRTFSDIEEHVAVTSRMSSRATPLFSQTLQIPSYVDVPLVLLEKSISNTA